jgi:hypothetical protein
MEGNPKALAARPAALVFFRKERRVFIRIGWRND